MALGSNSIAEWTQAALNIDGKMIDVTSIASVGFKEFIAGKVGGTIDIEGNCYMADTNGQLALTNAALARTKLTGAAKPKLSLSSGGPNITADAWVSRLKWGVPHDDKITFSCTLQLTSTIAYAAT